MRPADTSHDIQSLNGEIDHYSIEEATDAAENYLKTGDLHEGIVMLRFLGDRVRGPIGDALDRIAEAFALVAGNPELQKAVESAYAGLQPENKMPG